MKISVRPTSLTPLLLLFLGYLSGCNLLNEPECPEPPYYPFTAADKKWQSFTAKTEWLFENQRRQTRTYRVARIWQGEKHPWDVGVFTVRIGYYEDYWGVSWERTDSVAQAGYCQLQRIPVQKDPTQSVLSGEVQWEDYIGQANGMGGVNTRYLDFGNDLSVINFHSLTVRGVTYEHVTNFQTSAEAIKRLVQFNSQVKFKTTSLDYDRDAGVIRFTTLNGDVWERVP